MFKAITDKLFGKSTLTANPEPVKIPEPRKLYFTDEKDILRLAQFTDAINSGKRYHEQRFRLYQKIQGIYPETKEGSWTLSWEAADKVCVVEKLENS